MLLATIEHAAETAANGTPLLEVAAFFWRGLVAAGALAIACATIGPFVLLRREALVALVLPEAVVAGASVAMLLHEDEHRLRNSIIGVALALPLLAWTRYKRVDYLLPALYIAGLCIPFLVIAGHGQAHLGELQQVLTGYDVAVIGADAWLTLATALPCAVLCAALWRRWLLLAQSPATAQIATLHPVAWDLLFLALLGTIVLMGTHAMGVVMVLALLFLPAATALPWGRRIPTTLALSVVIALIDVALGFYLSVRFNWPFSQSVGGTGFAILIVSQVGAHFVRPAR